MTWTSIASDLTLDGVVGSYSPPPAAPMTYQPRAAAPERAGMGKLGAIAMGVVAGIVTFCFFSAHTLTREAAEQAAAAVPSAPVAESASPVAESASPVAEPAAPAEPVKGFYPPEAPKAEVPQAKLQYDSEPKVRQLAPAATSSTPTEPPADGDTQDRENLEKFRSMSRGI